MVKGRRTALPCPAWDVGFLPRRCRTSFAGLERSKQCCAQALVHCQPTRAVNARKLLCSMLSVHIAQQAHRPPLPRLGCGHSLHAGVALANLTHAVAPLRAMTAIPAHVLRKSAASAPSCVRHGAFVMRMFPAPRSVGALRGSIAAPLPRLRCGASAAPHPYLLCARAGQRRIRLTCAQRRTPRARPRAPRCGALRRSSAGAARRRIRPSPRPSPRSRPS